MSTDAASIDGRQPSIRVKPQVRWFFVVVEGFREALKCYHAGAVHHLKIILSNQADAAARQLR